MICNFINSVKAQNWTPPNTSSVVVTQDARIGVGVSLPSEYNQYKTNRKKRYVI